MKDPNPLVAGKGIEILKKANIKSRSWSFRRWMQEIKWNIYKIYNSQKPFCILKWASTLDGKICFCP